MAEAFDPDATIDASKADVVREVRRLTGEKGPDVVITATPSPTAQIQAVEMARKGACLALWWPAKGPVEARCGYEPGPLQCAVPDRYHHLCTPPPATGFEADPFLPVPG